MSGNSPLHRAAGLVQKYPLCFSGHHGSWRDRGFFTSLEECREALALICSVEHQGEGTAFGRSWPFLEYEGHILAPALPVPVSITEVLGPDGGYQRVGLRIERETAGLVNTFLDLNPSVDQSTSIFDLVWFSENERFVLDGPSLRISSLFADFSIAAHRADLDRLFRFFDLDGEMLAGWEPPRELDHQARVRVGKPLALIEEDRWKDPEAYLARRPEVKAVVSTASELVVTAIDGERVIYQTQHTESGWTVDLVEGHSLYPQIDVQKTSDALILRARIDPSLKVTRSDVRAQIAFDLNADL